MIKNIEIQKPNEKDGVSKAVVEYVRYKNVTMVKNPL